MNLEQLKCGPTRKASRSEPNSGNAVLDRLVELLADVLFGMPNVFITGSNVWRPALGIPMPEVTPDLDIILTGGDQEQLREVVKKALNITELLVPTGPSMTEARDTATLEGFKYLTKTGLVVDIWGMADIHRALQQYPQHSHAHARMAWDCEHGALLMYPNTFVPEPDGIPVTLGADETDVLEGFIL